MTLGTVASGGGSLKKRIQDDYRFCDSLLKHRPHTFLAAGDMEGLQELAFGGGRGGGSGAWEYGFSRIKSSDGRKVAAAMVSSQYFFTWIETEGSRGCRGHSLGLPVAVRVKFRACL